MNYFDYCFIQELIILACYLINTTMSFREVHDDVMEQETAPEIQRTNLAKVVLYLKTMNISDVLRYDVIIIIIRY